MKINKNLPWQLKIVIKLLLSRLPVTYKLWRWLGLFRHGVMDKPDYAFNIFHRHYDRVEFSSKGEGYTALELGPGDSAISGMIASVYGAKVCYLVDDGNYITDKMKVYEEMEAYLELKDMPVSLNKTTDLDSLFSAYNTRYFSNGLESIKKIPDNSVDFIWSQAVLEHIKADKMEEMMRELHRIQKHSGISSHRIDLKDHLGGALNNLRFSKSVWESKYFSNSGFYTNRLRYGELLEIFKKAGYEVSVISKDVWHDIPTPIRSMAKVFQNISEEELCISGFDVTLKKIE